MPDDVIKKTTEAADPNADLYSTSTATTLDTDPIKATPTDELTITQNQEPVLPDKFKDKSASEVAEMYSDLEKVMGRQGQELGEYRKLADNLLTQANKTTGQPAAKTEPEDEVNFEDDPEKATNTAIDKKLAGINAQLNASKAAMMKAELTVAHPDYEKEVVDPKFQEWISQSPVRMKLFQDANQNYNFDSANELFSVWKELKKYREAGTEQDEMEDEAAKLRRINSLSTETATSGQTSGKIFSRLALIKLKATNPERYAELSEEITQAYVDGRVK